MGKENGMDGEGEAGDGRSPPARSAAGIVARLRKLISDGSYPAGQRVAEIPVSAALGVSRTPVRFALRTLEQEGLLEKAGKRGFVVRAFSEDDTLCAVELRGVMEGLAARRLAERGMTPAVRAELLDCLAQGRQVLEKGYLSVDDYDPWSRLNGRLHRIIVHAAGSRVVADAIARNNLLPFASADSLAIDQTALDKEYEKLRIAQLHHQLIFEALDQGESARAEMLMREHAYIGLRYGRQLGLAS